VFEASGHLANFSDPLVDCTVCKKRLREIYLRPWEYIIKNADCMGIMTGNNSVNGVPCVMNKNLTGNILRKEFKFKGIAMSDWQNSQYFPLRQDLVLPSGQSLLMPSNETFANWLRIQIANKPEIKADFEKQLDEMIFPTLYTFFKMGTYDRFPQDVKYTKNQSERQLFAQRVAEEAIVLLKNKDNILPISKDKKIVMIGPPEIHSGYGSGFVTGFAHTNYADGLKNEYGDNFSSYTFLNLAAIDKADIVIYNLNKKSGEGADYPFEEPKNDLDTLNIIIKHHKHVVVLINAANTFPSNWLAGVDGVLWCSYLGQERGNALAAIISGKVSPSGKLPFTFEKDFSDSPDPDYNFVGGKPFWLGNNQYKNYWLGKTSEFKNEFTDYIKQGAYIPVPYQEGVFMGYRWYDATNKPVEFPFGFGLSYTHFKYTNIGITNNWKKDKSVIVSATIRNIGNVDAKEIVQLYVTDKESSVPRPPKELKAFEKINLKVGESKKVEFRLSEDAFSFWCNKSHQWLIEPGKFTISIGSSSRNLPLKMALMLN
jgi:beta-glucosidase